MPLSLTYPFPSLSLRHIFYSQCTVDTCDPSNGQCVFTSKDEKGHSFSCEDNDKCNGIYVCQNSTGECVIDTPEVDCNDNKACTSDKCITSTGLCTHELISCDDANECTLDDHCDNSTGCVFNPPLDNCCGNAECEASSPAFETGTSCPQDCSDGISTLDRSTYKGYLVRCV